MDRGTKGACFGDGWDDQAMQDFLDYVSGALSKAHKLQGQVPLARPDVRSLLSE